jgi:hypothetical protein
MAADGEPGGELCDPGTLHSRADRVAAFYAAEERIPEEREAAEARAAQEFDIERGEVPATSPGFLSL